MSREPRSKEELHKITVQLQSEVRILRTLQKDNDRLFETMDNVVGEKTKENKQQQARLAEIEQENIQLRKNVDFVIENTMPKLLNCLEKLIESPEFDEENKDTLECWLDLQDILSSLYYELEENNKLKDKLAELDKN